MGLLMTNRFTTPARSYLTLCKALLTAITLIILISGCNIRDNVLLPPNLDPKEYIVSNTIRVYSDHLIKSDNDDSYIYIPKESIADAGLWYGDIVRFAKTSNLTTRDSLAFVTNTQAVTNTYSISITRSGSPVLLDSLPAFATLYTDLKKAITSQTYYTQNGWRLSAAQVEFYPYGSNRVFWDISGSGDVALLDFGTQRSVQVSAGARDVQALIANAQDYVYIWLPAASLQADVSINLEDELSAETLSIAQSLFPGFALNTRCISYSGQDLSTIVPIVRYRLPQSKSWSQRWIKVNGSELTAWASGEDTWLQSENELVTFLNGSGKYFLATPLSEQDKLMLPLNGSIGHIYLQDMWIDLANAQLSGHSMTLDPSPDIAAIRADYFSGTPFTLSGDASAFRFEYFQGSTQLSSLPDGSWIEFGFRQNAEPSVNGKLFQVSRTNTSDKLFYKTRSTTYDASHYTWQNSFLYAGYSATATYIFGDITESSTSSIIPCLKAQSTIQTQRTLFSWDDSALPCSRINIEYSPALPSGHPWLSGQPFTLTRNTAIMKISPTYTRRGGSLLPANMYLETQYAGAVAAVANISLLPEHPRLVWYRSASEFGHNQFINADGRVKISPAYAGYLINSANLSVASSPMQVAMYSKMDFDYYDWEAYLNSETAVSAGTQLQVSSRATMTDTYGILASQYNLTQLSPSYTFRVINNPSFYSSLQPYLRIRHSSQGTAKLFSIADGTYFRLYTYDQAPEADAWHFANADGHAAFYLAFDGEFALMRDNAPHTLIEVPVQNALRDVHASVYQAQFVLPQEFLGNVVPIGSTVTLNAAPTLPPGQNAIAGAILNLRNAQNVAIAPGFYALPTATRLPYIYIPIDHYNTGQSVRMFYRNPLGIVTEYTRVDSFGTDPTFQFIMVGNCAVGFVNNPGLYYLTP